MSDRRDGSPTGLPISAGGARFLSGLTHELRTPLTSILMMSELLAENAAAHLDEREVRYARNVHEAASDLLALVDQAGEMGRVAAGRVRVEPAAVDLAGLARRLEERLGPAAAEAGASLAVTLDPGAPASLVTDGQLLERVVHLLVESAAKAAGGGTVRVVVGRPAGGAVTVTVADPGPPVPEDERARLLDPFAVVGSRTSRRFGGSGLGLPLAGALSALLGATLVVGEADGGTAITLGLPGG